VSGRPLTAEESRSLALTEQVEREHLARAEAALVDPQDLEQAQAAVADALAKLAADEDADPILVKAVTQFESSLRADTSPNAAGNFAIVAAWRSGFRAAK
jgi:hypothetical protein